MAKPNKPISRAEPAASLKQTAPAGTPTAASAQEAPSPSNAAQTASPGDSPVERNAVGELSDAAATLAAMDAVRGATATATVAAKPQPEPPKTRTATTDFFNQPKHVHSWEKKP